MPGRNRSSKGGVSQVDVLVWWRRKVEVVVLVVPVVSSSCYESRDSHLKLIP